MKKSLFLVAALLLCTAVRAQYFCTANKTELHYVNYDEAGQSISNETTTVYNAGNKDGVTVAQYLTKIVTNKTKNNTSYTLHNWSYDGSQTVCQEDLMYGPYIKSDSDPAKYDAKTREAMAEEIKFKGDNTFIIKDGARAGVTIPDYSYSYINNMLKNEVNISGAAYMGEERISTTTGKFDCTKISYLKRTKILLKTETLRITEWYAKEVGLIKSEAFDTKGKLHGKKLLVKIIK